MSDSFAAPLSVAHQSLLLMGFPRQEYWSGLAFPFPGDLPNPRIEPASPVLAGILSCYYSLLAQRMFKVHLKFMNECIKIHLHGI